MREKQTGYYSWYPVVNSVCSPDIEAGFEQTIIEVFIFLEIKVQVKTDEDKQLIDAAKADIDNFRFLYEKYVKAVYRYTYNRLGKNKELAEDITSETFVKAIEKFESFKYQNKPFVVWLYTVAHNLIVDHFRDKKEKNVSLDSLVIPPSDENENIIDQLSKEELKEKITDKLSELPDEIANIFTLRHTEDLSFAQIGKLLGKSGGAVKMKYYRGLKYLKKLVSDDEKSLR